MEKKNRNKSLFVLLGFLFICVLIFSNFAFSKDESGNPVASEENEIIKIVQDETGLQYHTDFNNIKITLYKGEEEITATFFDLNNMSLKFGGRDPNPNGIQEYRYIFESSAPLKTSGNDIFFEDHDLLIHQINFDDICLIENSDCKFKLFQIFDKYFLDLRFNSDGNIDPTINVTTRNSQEFSLLALTQSTFIIARLTGGNLTINSYNIKGVPLNSVNVVTGLTTNARVKLTSLNNTNFIIGWYDDVGNDYLYQLYNFSLSSTSTAQDVSSALALLSDNADLSMSVNENNLYYCYYADTLLTDSVNMNVINLNTLGSGTTNVINGASNPEAPLMELLSCKMINSTRVGLVYFDDPVNDITFNIINSSGTSLTARDLDTTAGETAQTDSITLYRNLTGLLYDNSGDNNVYFSIVDKSNVTILPVTTIDVNAGSDPRVSIASAKYQNKSVFVTAWNDVNAGMILAKIFTENGTQLYNYTLANDENVTNLHFDIYGNNEFTGIGICNETFLFAYQNTANQLIVKTLWVNGTLFDGNCDFQAPSIANRSPANDTFSPNRTINFNVTAIDNLNLSNVTIFIFNSSGGLVYQNTSFVSGVSAFVNDVFTFATDGIFTWFYNIFDSVGNLFTTDTFLIEVDDTPFPNILMTYPQNITYNFLIRELNYSITGNNVGACWYSLNNGVTNITITCGQNVTGLESLEGNNTWTIYANNSLSGFQNFSRTTFTSFCTDIEGQLIVPSFPFVDVNVTYPLKVGSFPSGDAELKIEITNPNTTTQSFNLTYNATTDTFDINLLFTEIGDYPFVIFGNDECPTLSANITGTFIVRQPFFVTFIGFNNKTGGRYINEFAFVTAEFATRAYDSNLEPLINSISFYKIFTKPVFHDDYIGGEATLKLWENDTYAVRLVDGQITFPSTYSIPNVTKTYGTNVYLGLYYLNQTTTYNVFLSEKDLHPYRWLFNLLLIIFILLLGVLALGLLFVMPQYPLLSIAVAIVGFGFLIILRIAIWLWTGN